MALTIVISFVQAARGCSTSALIFWLTLFSATALCRHVEDDRRKGPVRVA
jgi:hypothetical protein